jgi:hypothetical protein
MLGGMPQSPQTPAAQSPGRGVAFVERWVLPYLRDPALWPVLFVLVGHGVVAIAILLLLAARDGSGAGWVVLGLVAAASAGVARFERRWHGLGALSAVLLATWLLAGGLAVVADRYRLY